MRERTRSVLALAFNGLAVLAEILWMVLYPGRLVPEVLQWYTYLNNFLGLSVSLVFVVFAFRELLGHGSVPHFVRTLRWISCTGLALTFLTVVFLLAPLAGPDGYGKLMFSGSLLFVHTVCPLLSLIPFLCFERSCAEPGSAWYRDLPLAVAPTGLYILVSVTMNLTRAWHGPYPFLYVYEQPWYASVLWLLFFAAAASGTALGLRAVSGLHKR